MEAGTVPDCLAAQCIANMDKIGMTELELAYSVSTPFGAGIETTAGTLTVFVLAMLHYPQVVKKAQIELDTVVGHERLPEFQDRQNLSYINAIVNETLRWRPVAILGGTPHAVVADDVYKEMYIPRGSTVFANFDRIMHDPEMFPDPEDFRPERFIDSSDPRIQDFDLPFGFGRRQCPGQHLALNSLFINISRLLWGFDITPALDEQGNPVLPVLPPDSNMDAIPSRTSVSLGVFEVAVKSPGRYMQALTILQQHISRLAVTIRRFWESAQRTTRRSGGIDAVVIFAILRSKTNAFPVSTVIIEQYRPPIDKFIIGLIDEGETAEQAAIRELREETGYKADEVVESSPVVVADPGMTNANMKLVILNVFFEGALETPDQQLDSGEFIVRKVVELKKLHETLQEYDRKVYKLTLSRTSMLTTMQGFAIDAKLHHLATGYALALQGI
ncbi:hypothetical protein D9758_001784 [Tetrapyrgos nigripes]|uniref:Nudix hydrolase domain-containing protein n=1 Tax=Tetrapyrgos nigripes TaxID=182062 RepID=A0A8H5LWU7_9AGAR|nr:hypothetical protein D9758_001784 [Tetrapyrgos nigripes]